MTETEPAFKVGDRAVLRYTGNLVRITEMLDGDKARVSWMTAGKKHPTRTYWLRSPQQREKVVRLSSLNPMVSA